MKIILLGHQNDYTRNSGMSNAVKSFDIVTTSLSDLHNYFNSLTNLFLNTYHSYIFRYFNKIVLYILHRFMYI